jgi:hypothetical protein
MRITSPAKNSSLRVVTASSRLSIALPITSGVKMATMEAVESASSPTDMRTLYRMTYGIKRERKITCGPPQRTTRVGETGIVGDSECGR